MRIWMGHCRRRRAIWCQVKRLSVFQAPSSLMMIHMTRFGKWWEIKEPIFGTTNETFQAYFNPALDDDSSSDSSSSFTDTEDEETVKQALPKVCYRVPNVLLTLQVRTAPSSPVPTPATPPPLAPAKVPSPLAALSSTTSAEPAKMTAIAGPAFGSDSDSDSSSLDSF